MDKEIAVSISSEPMDSSIPPKFIKRNSHGLICNELVNYIYTPDGMIDWRKLIEPAHLVPNKQFFEDRHKPVPNSIDGLEDKELLILLAGLKKLSQVRGYNKVDYRISANENYVAAICTIEWIPNFETENRTVTFSAIGDASPQNTNGFGRKFLAAIAENRAFVRCVRNFLKINIVGQEEVSGVGFSELENTDLATSLLEKTMREYNISFEVLKAALIKENYQPKTGMKVEDYKGVNDIEKFKQFELVERIKKKHAGKTI